jgi:hypothetical protein
MVSDFFEWRWAPCVGLTAGSLAFVAFALLLIPTRFGGEPRVSTTLSSFDSPRTQRALYGASLARSVTEPEARGLDDARVARFRPRPSPQAGEMAAPPARGFSPILERPAPPPPPPPPPPLPPPLAPATVVEAPAPTPAPAIGTVTVTQPVAGGESREPNVQ